MAMTAQQMKDLIDETEHTAHSYSGRAMYGVKCVAVSVPNQFKFLAELMAAALYNEVDIEELSEVVEHTRIDSMGRDDVVLYWPQLSAEGVKFHSDCLHENTPHGTRCKECGEFCEDERGIDERGAA